MNHSREEELGPPLSYDPDFQGPLKKRSCTDICCLLIFLTFIGCWAGLAAFAFLNGNPKALLIPKDSYGSRCGIDENVKNKPYLFFFDLGKCLDPKVPFTGCPTKQICVEQCPQQYFSWNQDSQDITKLICDYDTNIHQPPEYIKDKCAQWYLPSIDVEHRCIPNINSIDKNKLPNNYSIDKLEKIITNLKLLSQAEQVAQNIVNDIIVSWWKILIGIGMATLICIIYIFIMRWIATFMVWFSIIGIIIFLSFSIYFSATKYIELKNNPTTNTDDYENQINKYLKDKNTWLVLLILASILLFIVVFILIFLRKRILLAIALVKEGSKAVSSVTSVLFFPIFPWILQLLIIVFSISVALYLSTTGDSLYKVKNMDINCNCGFKNGDFCDPKKFVIACGNCLKASCKYFGMENPKYYPYLQVFNAIGFLWGTFFVSAMGQMILASVFATWYWTWNKSRLPFFAVTDATCTVLSYHIGTIALGSFIITICRVIRIMLEYVDQKLKKYDNEITKAIMCCMKCFFWCLENFLKFINRNAYIMCAIHGKNFYTSAKDAFNLLMRNILRVFVLDKVTDFLFFLGKLILTIGVGAVAYTYFATDFFGDNNLKLNYELVPVISIMICTYLIATIFFNVYSMAVDTLFLCFLEDCERNDGSSNKPYFMSKNLMKIFNKKNKRE